MFSCSINALVKFCKELTFENIQLYKLEILTNKFTFDGHKYIVQRARICIAHIFQFRIFGVFVPEWLWIPNSSVETKSKKYAPPDRVGRGKHFFNQDIFSNFALFQMEEKSKRHDNRVQNVIFLHQTYFFLIPISSVNY